jgi:D-arabinose 1-dehydrogenase-like Zn-dependent alcohol dehydrogenase
VKCFECAASPTEDDPDADKPGYSVSCPHVSDNGISCAGGLAEYAAVDERQVALLSEVMCASVTGYTALKTCKLGSRQRVGIIGCGGGLGYLGL